MQDNKNSYESLKSDVKGAATGLFFTGGFIFLIIVLLSIIVAVCKSGLESGFKTIIVVILGGILALLFNNKARTWILGAWLILLVAAIVLPMFFLAFYIMYSGLK